MEFRVWRSGASLWNLIFELRRTTPWTWYPENLLTSNYAWNWISLDLDSLEYTSNLPNASVRTQRLYFIYPLWHTPLEITHLDILPTDFDIPLQLITYPFTLIVCQNIALMKLFDSEHKMRHWPEICQEARRGKIMKITIKGYTRYWNYNI